MLQACIEGFDSHFQKEQFLYLAWIKSYWHYKLSIISYNVDNFWSAQGIKIAPSGNVNRSLLNMLAKYFSTIRKYVLSVSSQRKYNFCHQNTHLDAFRMNSHKVIGRNPSMVIPLLANQDLTPMLCDVWVTCVSIWYGTQVRDEVTQNK